MGRLHARQGRGIDRDASRVEYGDVREQTLAPPEKFAACLAATDLRDRIQCLKGVTSDAAATCATGTVITRM